MAAGAADPVFEEVGHLFKVTLYPINASIGGGANGGANELLEFIRLNPGQKTNGRLKN